MSILESRAGGTTVAAADMIVSKQQLSRTTNVSENGVRGGGLTLKI